MTALCCRPGRTNFGKPSAKAQIALHGTAATPQHSIRPREHSGLLQTSGLLPMPALMAPHCLPRQQHLLAWLLSPSLLLPLTVPASMALYSLLEVSTTRTCRMPLGRTCCPAQVLPRHPQRQVVRRPPARSQRPAQIRQIHAVLQTLQTPAPTSSHAAPLHEQVSLHRWPAGQLCLAMGLPGYAPKLRLPQVMGHVRTGTTPVRLAYPARSCVEP